MTEPPTKSAGSLTSRVLAMLPPAVAGGIVNRLSFADDVTRHGALDDAELLSVVEVCLKNLPRIEDETNHDADLRVVVVPELCERITPGVRDRLRRISSTLAEYSPSEASFWYRTSPGSVLQLRKTADDLRMRLAEIARLDDRSLFERTKFAIAGSCAARRWSASDHVYEPAFAYRIAPIVALRVRGRSRASSTRPTST